MNRLSPLSVCSRALAAALVVSFAPASASAQTDGAAAPPAEAKPKAQPSWMRKGGPVAPPPAPPPPPPPPPPPDPAAIAEATARDEARKHFEQGLALFDAGSVATALPEFLLSRSIYPTRSATKNAALCLRRLGRFDEALDMNEELLSMSGLTPAEKEVADKELSELRPVVGGIEIEGIQPGATISIDSKPRATTPLTKPIHVPVGTRVVRIFKAGFETFEQRVEAVGGKNVSVRAVLAPLELSGWLQVDEASGYNVDVVLDGSVVGKTPWRGLIATGDHLVVLRGDKRLGTQPARVEVRPSQVTPMLLIVEELPSVLRVESKTKGADVFVDGVRVGRGAWEGAVRQGSHRVQVGAEGFVMAEQRIDIGSDKREVVSLEPVRAAPKGFWDEHSPFVEIRGAASISPGFGGEIGDPDDCPAATCTSSYALGGMGILRVGLMLDRSWSLGLDFGGLGANQQITGRTTSIYPLRLGSSEGTANHARSLLGGMVGFSLGHTIGERFPLTLQLGTGAFLGGMRDRRTNGTFTILGTTQTQKAQGETYVVEDVGQGQPVRGVYVAPEVRFGVRVARRLDLSASLGALVIFLPNPPVWDPEASHVQADSDGLATYGSESLSDSVLYSFTPGIAATYRFF